MLCSSSHFDTAAFVTPRCAASSPCVTCAARRSRAMAAPKLMSCMRGSFFPFGARPALQYGGTRTVDASEHRLTFPGARQPSECERPSSEPCPRPRTSAPDRKNPPSRLVHGFERNVAFSRELKTRGATRQTRPGETFATGRMRKARERKLAAFRRKPCTEGRARRLTERRRARASGSARDGEKLSNSEACEPTCGAPKNPLLHNACS